MKREPIFIVKDKWSTITHFIGFIISIISYPFLLVKTAYDGLGHNAILALCIFTVSATLLYGASSAYHAFNISPKVNTFLRKLDHCSIFILIAGSYTPIYLVGLGDARSKLLLSILWGLCFLGIIFKICWITCPKWVSSVMYIALGWIAILSIKDMYLRFTTSQFLFLVLGGVFYTIGGIIYSFKPKLFKNEEETGFGNHELFHIFILLGTACHYVMLLLLA